MGHIAYLKAVPSTHFTGIFGSNYIMYKYICLILLEKKNLKVVFELSCFIISPWIKENCPSFRHYMYMYIFLEKGMALHLLFAQGCSVQPIWRKLAMWFWRRRKVVNAFSLSCYYLPLAKDYTLHLNKRESPTVLCAKYGWNWHTDSWREFEDVENLNDNERYKSNFQSENLTWAVQLWAEYELIFPWK